jgi:hypothetical protein
MCYKWFPVFFLVLNFKLMFNTKFVTYYPENRIVIFFPFSAKSPYLILKIPTRRQITKNYSAVKGGDCLCSYVYKSIGRLNLKDVIGRSRGLIWRSFLGYVLGRG